MTFRVCNLGSKQPHLYSAYVVSVAFQSHTTVSISILLGLQGTLTLLVIAGGGHHPLATAFGSHFNLNGANWL